MENMYQVYDLVVMDTIGKIVSSSHDKNVIALAKFNPNNENHLYLMNVALISGGLNGKPVSVDLSLIKWIKFSRMYKAAIREKRLLRARKGWMNCYDTLGEIREKSVHYKELPFGFSEIYQEYYKPKKEKKEEE